ncbi:unnamed protein product, partial [Didymodactylos carnosus]
SLPVRLVEKFIRIKHNIEPTLKIDLFYKTHLLDLNERLIDVCYCFNQTTKKRSLDIRFVISQKGYLTIIEYLRRKNLLTIRKKKKDNDTVRSLRPRLLSTIESNRTPKLSRRQSIAAVVPIIRRSVNRQVINDEQPCIAVERFIEDPIVEDNDLAPLHIDTTQFESSIIHVENVDTEANLNTEQQPVKTNDIISEKQILSSGASTTSSTTDPANDPSLKVKIRRVKTSWYIPQQIDGQHTNTNPTEEQPLPDLINSCSKKITKRKKPITDKSSIFSTKKLCTTKDFFSSNRTLTPSIIASTTKPVMARKKRKARFVPTMVKPPMSIFDRDHLLTGAYDYCDDFDFRPCSSKTTVSIAAPRSPEIVIINVEGGVETNESNGIMGDSTVSTLQKKNICKVPPYVPETSSLSPVKLATSLPVVVVPASDDKIETILTTATLSPKKNDIPPSIVDVSSLTTTTDETLSSTKKIRMLNSVPKLKTTTHKPFYFTKPTSPTSSSSISPNMTTKRTLLPKTTSATKTIKIVSSSTSSSLKNSVRNITLNSSDKTKQLTELQCSSHLMSSSTLSAPITCSFDTIPLDLSMKRS